MPNWSGLFGEGSIAQQMFVYGVLQSVISALMAPGIVELQQGSMREFQPLDLPAADAAQAVARGLIDRGAGTDNARGSGFSDDLFDTMTELARHAPGLTVALTAFHRGLINKGTADGTDVSLRGALADAGIPDGWHDVIVDAALDEPSREEVMNALLGGQISETEARRRYARAGGDMSWMQSDFDARGEAPTPMQALELWNRGIIPESGTGPNATSYEQAFLEGPWRNKWLKAFKALRVYLPPPRTITAMVHAGAMTHDQGLHYLTLQGLTPELAAQYLTETHQTKTTTEKELAKTDVVALYTEGLITKADALHHLTALKYTAQDAQLMIKLAEYRNTASQMRAAVTRARALYLNGELTDSAAQRVLHELGVPADQTAGVVSTWRLVHKEIPKTLTAAEIISSWYYEIIDGPTALDRLQGLGYTRDDAWIMLAVRNKSNTIKGLPRPGKGH